MLSNQGLVWVCRDRILGGTQGAARGRPPRGIVAVRAALACPSRSLPVRGPCATLEAGALMLRLTGGCGLQSQSLHFP